MAHFPESSGDKGREPDAPNLNERYRDMQADGGNASKKASPPTSIKAFAAARRRERAASISDSDSTSSESETASLRRILSPSKISYMSDKFPTIDDSSESSSSEESEEDRVRLERNQPQQRLYIDFDFLENFIYANQPTGVSDEVSSPQGGNFSIPGANGIPSSPRLKARLNLFKPNRFSFFSSSLDSTIHAPELADLVLPGEEIRNLFTIPEDEGGAWWLDCQNATKDEVQNICTAFGVHPLIIEDIVTKDAHEKIEMFSSYYLVSFQSFYTVTEDNGGVEYEPFNMYILVFREGTLSFSFSPNSHALYVRQRITALKEHVSLSSDWICYALIDNIVDEFGPVIRQIEHDVDTLEDDVFIMRDFDSTSFLLRIGQVRNNIISLLRLLGGKPDVLRSFTKRCNENYIITPGMDIGMYLDDIQDHVVTMVANLGHFENILSRAHSNYLATVTVNGLNQGSTTNDVLGKIVLLTSIFVPLHLVSLVFGMNVPVPFGGVDEMNLAPFFGIIGVMAVMGIVVMAWARHNRWI